jgi:hypothetical protein
MGWGQRRVTHGIPIMEWIGISLRQHARAMNPTYPWICVLGATVLQLVSIALFIRDPEKAEE